MTSFFGATSTADEVLRGINLSGKRVLVTGVSAGLGVETARTLAAHGAEVVGVARDLSGGRYCEDCHVAEVVPVPGLRGGVHPYALDPQRAQALWQKSEELVGERFSVN